MEKKITCIICPRGCPMTAVIEGDCVKVSGHSCPKGEEYAVNECTNPVRTVTATVRVDNRRDTMVSVKTENPVPKGSMQDVMVALRKITVKAPIAIGDVVLEDVFGTKILATKEVL